MFNRLLANVLSKPKASKEPEKSDKPAEPEIALTGQSGIRILDQFFQSQAWPYVKEAIARELVVYDMREGSRLKAVMEKGDTTKGYLQTGKALACQELGHTFMNWKGSWRRLYETGTDRKIGGAVTEHLEKGRK